MNKNLKGTDDAQFAFGKMNYILLIAGVVVIVLGFILMSGGGSDDPAVFSPEIFSARRITVAPIVVLLGFGLIGYSIFHLGKSELSAQKSSNTDATRYAKAEKDSKSGEF